MHSTRPETTWEDQTSLNASVRVIARVPRTALTRRGQSGLQRLGYQLR